MNRIFILIMLFCQISCKYKTDKEVITFTEKKQNNASDSTKEFDRILESFNGGISFSSNRGTLLFELNKIDDPRKEKILELALFDNEEFVQIMAIQAIRANMTKQSSKELLKLFKISENPTIISNLCRTFVDFKFKQAIPEVVKKTKSKNSMIIYDCIWTIGEIGSENEIPTLKEMIQDKTMPKIYDEDGFLSQSTEISISEQALKSIKKIEKASW